MSQKPDPVSANAGKLKISVEPGLELLCAVQSLADYLVFEDIDHLLQSGMYEKRDGQRDYPIDGKKK